MNPWNILAWLLIAVISIPVILIILGSIFGVWKLLLLWLTNKFKHIATRNIPPQEGQIWRQSGGKFGGLLTITKIHDNGAIAIKSGNASWGDSAKDWKQRVKNRQLVLISQPKKD